MIPDYLPGVHPLLVHFPIALLTVAVLVDLAAAIRRSAGWRGAATALLVGGALTLIPTYLAGRWAVDAMQSPFPAAETAASAHADSAWLTLLVFLAVAAVRLAIAWWGRLDGWRHTALLVAGVAAWGLLVQTADRGGRLVFDLGVGVRPVREAPEGAFAPEPEIDPSQVSPLLSEDGSLRWDFPPGAEQVLGQAVEVIAGTLPEATVEARASSLVLTLPEAAAPVLALGAPLENLRASLSVNLDAFDGSLALLHHVGGPDSYGYLRWDGRSLLLGQVVAGRAEEFDRATVEAASGWHQLTVVAAGRHLRGYLDGELLVHGHADPLPAGRIGLLLQGSGSVRLAELRADSAQE